MLEGIKPPRRVDDVCKVATIIKQLGAPDNEILAAAIMDVSKWPANTLATELRKRKLSIFRHDNSSTPQTDLRLL